jgi:hypothetical protein
MKIRIDVGTGVKVTRMVHGTFRGLRFEGATFGIDTTSGGNSMLNMITCPQQIQLLW